MINTFEILTTYKLRIWDGMSSKMLKDYIKEIPGGCSMKITKQGEDTFLLFNEIKK